MTKRLKNHLLLMAMLMWAIGSILPTPAFAQSDRVSVKLNKQPLSELIKAIETQTNYSFFYEAHQIDVSQRISVSMTDAAISNVLNVALNGTGISYSISEKTITLFPKPVKDMAGSSAFCSGKVTDIHGDPLPGAVIYHKGAANGVNADLNGYYSIPASVGDILEFTYLGYKSAEYEVPSSREIDVVLTEDTFGLDETVVVGYGTMKQKELTSAISHIGANRFNNVFSSDAAMLIQGKVAGVSVTNIGMADPNTYSSIQVRGISSRSAGLSPLVIVDGVPGSLTYINPDDIASFDILKDGAASSIYGTRGSNGVILINLKKSAKDRTAHTSYNFSYTINKAKRELDILNAADFRKYRAASSVDYGADTDWFEEATRTGLAQSHSLSVSGGNENTNYRLSVRYKNANGIDRHSNKEDYDARANISHTTKSGLFTFIANIYPDVTNYKSTVSSFSNVICNNPTAPVKNEDGTYFDFYGDTGWNMVEYADLLDQGGQYLRMGWDGTAQINILPLLNPARKETSLTGKITYSETYGGTFRYYFTPSTLNANIRENYKGDASRSYERNLNQNIDATLNYSDSFAGGHNVSAMLGYNYFYYVDAELSGMNRDFQSDALTYNALGSGTWLQAEAGRTGVASSKNDHKLIGFVTRANYNYKSRYLVSASLRYEGSSRFGANNKWGYFPAFSLGWRISSEPFMKDISWIDDLKLRYDYGITGNQNIADYQSLATYSAQSAQGQALYYVINGQTYRAWGPSRNANPNLRWEKGYNQNFGVDFSILSGRVAGSLNYYKRQQKDLLGAYYVAVPPALFTTTNANVGSLKNTGIEMELNFEAVKNGDFSDNISLVAATNNNEFVSFSNDVYTGTDSYWTCSMANRNNPGYLQRIDVGERIGNYCTLRYAGVSDDGGWLFYNKDGKVIPSSEATDDDREITGNGLPKLTGSLTNTMRWKNFDWTISLRGAFGFQLFDVHEFYFGLQNLTGNTLKKAYTKNAAITTGMNIISDYFIYPGDYLKLDNMTFGYNLKLKNKYINHVRLYATGNNLYTFTKFPGVDPSTYEVNGLTPGTNGGSYDYYPSAFQFIFGVQIDF